MQSNLILLDSLIIKWRLNFSIHLCSRGVRLFRNLPEADSSLFSLLFISFCYPPPPPNMSNWKNVNNWYVYYCIITYKLSNSSNSSSGTGKSTRKGETGLRMLVPNACYRTNKNCISWARTYFAEQLEGLEAEDKGHKIRISKMEECNGDVDLNQRKGKIITIYDVALKLSLEGIVSGIRHLKST